MISLACPACHIYVDIVTHNHHFLVGDARKPIRINNTFFKKIRVFHKISHTVTCHVNMSSRAGYDTVPKPVSGSHPAAAVNPWAQHKAADAWIEEQQLFVPDVTSSKLAALFAAYMVGLRKPTGPRPLEARCKLIRVIIPANTGVLADVPYMV